MRWFSWLYLNRQLEDEQRFHIDMRIQEYVTAGMNPEQARLRALRQFGNRTLLKERTREMHAGIWFETLLQDLRYAARTLYKSPGFTLVAIFSLALGIATNSTVFSAIDALLLRPLPYSNASRLVAIFDYQLKQPDRRFHVSLRDLYNLGDKGLVEHLEGSAIPDMTAMSGAGEPERVGFVAVTPGFLPLLGVRPALGRLLVEDDFTKRQIVLSYAFWRRHFGADPSVVGKSLVIDNGSWKVVGVLSPGFDFFGQGQGDIFRLTIFRSGQFQSDNNRWLFGVGRLKLGVSIAQAQSSVDATAKRLEQTFPRMYQGLGIRLLPLQEALFGAVRPTLIPLSVAVALVLLIACTNIANLLLSRGATRRKEISVRAAIGASRSRLIRQMLTESLLLSLLGGTVGLMLAFGGIRIFVALAPRWMPQASAMTIDLRVLVFTALLSVLTGMVFGVMPAFRSSQMDLNGALKDGTGTDRGTHRQRTRSVMVVVEMALAMTLMAAAGLMINTFIRLLRVYPGFAPDQLLSVEVRLLGPRYFVTGQFVKTGLDLVTPEVGAFRQRMMERVKALPGVEGAALIDWLPMGENQQRQASGIRISGESALHPGERAGAMYSATTPDYFEVMRIPLLRGRHFTEQDQENTPWVVVINDAMAHRFWPKQDPIGQVISLDTVPEERPREIVGVVGNVRQLNLEVPAIPEMYIPYPQQPMYCTAAATEERLHLSLVMRTRLEDKTMFEAVHKAIRELDQDAPIFGMRTMKEAISNSAIAPRFLSQLLGGFAAMSLLLSAIGIYGVISYSVSERRREIGLRMALGAQSGEILRMVLKQGLLLAIAGAAIGLAASYATAPIMGKLLFGIKPHDLLTLGLATAFLIVVALFATWLPAWRAVKLDPLRALHHE